MLSNTELVQIDKIYIIVFIYLCQYTDTQETCLVIFVVLVCQSREMHYFYLLQEIYFGIH